MPRVWKARCIWSRDQHYPKSHTVLKSLTPWARPVAVGGGAIGILRRGCCVPSRRWRGGPRSGDASSGMRGPRCWHALQGWQWNSDSAPAGASPVRTWASPVLPRRESGRRVGPGGRRARCERLSSSRTARASKETVPATGCAAARPPSPSGDVSLSFSALDRW